MKKQEALSGILVDSFLGLQHFAQMSRNKIDLQGFIHGPATHGILFQVQDFSSAIFYDTCVTGHFEFLFSRGPGIRIE